MANSQADSVATEVWRKMIMALDLRQHQTMPFMIKPFREEFFYEHACDPEVLGIIMMWSIDEISTLLTLTPEGLQRTLKGPLVDEIHDLFRAFELEYEL